MFWRGIFVNAEVTHTFELHLVQNFYVCQCWLHFAILKNLQRVWIQIVEECLAFFAFFGSFHSKQSVEQTNFGINGMICRYPVNCTFYLAAIGRITATRSRVVGTVNFGDR